MLQWLQYVKTRERNFNQAVDNNDLATALTFLPMRFIVKKSSGVTFTIRHKHPKFKGNTVTITLFTITHNFPTINDVSYNTIMAKWARTDQELTLLRELNIISGDNPRIICAMLFNNVTMLKKWYKEDFFSPNAINIAFDLLKSAYDLDYMLLYMNTLDHLTKIQLRRCVQFVPSTETCSICLNTATNCLTQCNHYYHYKCLKQWVAINNKCPYCCQIINENSSL